MARLLIAGDHQSRAGMLLQVARESRNPSVAERREQLSAPRLRSTPSSRARARAKPSISEALIRRR